MANHLTPTKTKTQAKPRISEKVLPRLFHFRLSGKRRTYERSFELFEILLLLAAALLFLLGCFLPAGWTKLLAFAAAAVLAALTPLRRCLRRVGSRRLPDEDLLVLTAVILLFCLREYAAGTLALILYRFADLVQAYALARGEGGMDLLRGILPEKARLDVGNSYEETVPEAVQPGDVLLVMAGEVIPVDGEVVDGVSEIDLSPLAGAECTKSVAVGSEVLSGSVNVSGDLKLRALRGFEDSAAALLISSFSASEQSDSYTERKVNQYVSLFVPLMLALTVLIGLVPPLFNGNWAAGLHRAAVLLLISSPAALAISVPMTYTGALACASRHGILAKGKERIEQLARVKTMIFGKTGTITDGKYVITDVFPHGVTERELLSVAAAAESYSRHPIAVALKQAAGWTKEVAGGVIEVEEIPGKGISAFIEGRHVYVGNAGLMEEHGVWFAQPTRSGAAIHVAVENEYWGHILMGDKIREASYDSIEDLRSQGVDNMVMLTGDVLSVTRPLAASLNFDMVRAELDRAGKISAIEYLQRGKGERNEIAYVGNGITDREIYRSADLSIAVDALESREAIETADFSLLNADLRLIPTMRRIATAAYWISVQNVLLVCAVKLILILLGAFGAMPVMLAAVLDTLSSVLASLNALRIFLVER